MQEVSRVHSTDVSKLFNTNTKLQGPVRKEQIYRKKLNPYYVSGFIDGEGSFSVSFCKHKTLQRKIEIHAEFEIELRADDREILERILVTIGCGVIYDCAYERYGWYPHVKYKVSSTKDMEKYLIPFLDKYPLQAKKAKVYKIFREIILLIRNKTHLTDKGFNHIQKLRGRMRIFGKKHTIETARVRENRSPGGARQ